MHDRDHVPKVKSHHVGIGGGQHALHGRRRSTRLSAGASAIANPACVHANAIIATVGGVVFSIASPGNADHADRIGSQPDQQRQSDGRTGGEQDRSAAG